MKNKIISLLLLAAMCMSVLLTSCSEIDTGYEEETSTIPDITLSIYGIKEDGTTDEAIDLVEAEINRYTQDKYKTTLELNFFSEEEYGQTVEDAFIKIDEQTERNELAEKAATAATKAAREAAKTLSIDEQKEKKRAQREYEKWAEAREAEGDVGGEVDIEMSSDIQLDLFLVNDYEYYQDLIERERIADISSPLTGTHNLITKYVNPVILSVAKVNGSYYGVPANRLMGAGKQGYYYAFRTDLAEKYGYEITAVPALNLNTIDLWLEQIAANEKGVSPFFLPPAVIQNFDFYMDSTEYPAYGTKNLEANETTSNEIQFTLHAGVPGSMTHGTAYFHFRKMYRYRAAGYFAPEGSDPKTTDFALGVFHGTLDEVKAQLGDKADRYTYATYAYPRVVTQDLFGSTFVVSASCKYPDRAVQVIKGFCTDEKLRNLITYGIEDVHYEVNDDGETITKLTNDYNIGFETYGNSLIGYVPEELGATYQADAVVKNLNIKSSAFVGFTHKLEEVDVKAFEEINKIVAEYLPQLMNGYDVSNTEDVNNDGVVNVDDVFEEINTRLGKYEDVLGLYPNANEDDGGYTEPYINLQISLDSSFAGFAGSRPGSTGEIDNSIITKEEAERREELLAPEEGEVDPSLEGEAPAEGEILPEGTEPVEEAEAELDAADAPVEE